jgi:transcriptional regulator with XRE-family HTH domain
MSHDDTTTAARQGLGRAIAVQRVHLGLKRKDLAQRAELSYPYISELENGGKEPSAKALRQIADALELSVGELIAMGERYIDPLGPMDVPNAALANSATPEPQRAARSAPLGTTSPGASLRPPASATDALSEVVRRVVREELERFVADELPVAVSREVRRALTDPGSG